MTETYELQCSRGRCLYQGASVDDLMNQVEKAWRDDPWPTTMDADRIIAIDDYGNERVISFTEWYFRFCDSLQEAKQEAGYEDEHIREISSPEYTGRI